MSPRRRGRIATSHHPAQQVFQLQDVVMHSDPIDQNDWYDLFTSGKVAAGAGSVERNVMVYSISTEQAVANEDLEIRIIADNVDETLTQTAVAGTNYHVNLIEDPDSLVMFEASTTSLGPRRAFLFQARSLQIMFRKTTAAGGNDTTVKILYAKIP